MQSDCQDYIKELSDNIEGGMAFIISSWDNRDGRAADFECDGMCPEPAASCDNSVTSISNIVVKQYGSNEDPPKPEPIPEPAEFQ